MKIFSRIKAIVNYQWVKDSCRKLYTGLFTNWKIALVSLVLILPLLIITINHYAASGAAVGAEPQEDYEYLALLFSEPVPELTDAQPLVEPVELLSAQLPVVSSPEPSPAPSAELPAEPPSGLPSEPSVEPSAGLPAQLPTELPAVPLAESSADPPDDTSLGLNAESPAEASAELVTGSTETAESTAAGSAAGDTTEADPPDTRKASSFDEAYGPNNSQATGNKTAYITIDDGPSREVTTGILDLLQQEGIKATFFVLPHGGVKDLYQRIIDEGHEIGNHSYSHNYSKLYTSNDISGFEEDVLLAQEWLFDNFGYLSTSFRFPGGAMGRKASIVDPRREFLEEHGYRDFDWHVDTGDANNNYKDKSAAALSQRVLDNTRDRERLIVLMHDTKSKATTLQALPLIITGLREQGYTFDILRNY